MDAIEELLTRGVEKIYPSKEALEKMLRSGKKLRLYQGFDPTGIQLHIGHMVGFRKLRQFQDLGHHIIFLIGDGTGLAGDPSGKSRAREKFLTNEQLRQNAKDYVFQAKNLVNFTGENPVEILYNGDWLRKLALEDILDIAGRISFAQMAERDLYQERLKAGITFSLREFLYPLLQGYDSVAMNVDLELGGSDQTFNMLMGRHLVKSYLHKEKFVMTTPLLTDSSGKKIGKTEGNVIAITSKPEDLYGMVMNLPDDVIIKSFEFITDLPLSTVAIYKKALADGENPMKYKKLLARTLVTLLHDVKAGEAAQKSFETLFQNKIITASVPEWSFPEKTDCTLVEVLILSKTAHSRSQAKTLIRSGAVEIDGEKATDMNLMLSSKRSYQLRVGKHTFLRVNP